MYKDPQIILQLEAVTNLCDSFNVSGGEVKAVNLDGDRLSIKHSTRQGKIEHKEYYWSDNHQSWISEVDNLSNTRALEDALESLYLEAGRLSRGIPAKAFDEAMSAAEILIKRGLRSKF